MPADYDGDGRPDIAVYRQGIWFIIRSSDGVQTTVEWGGGTHDIPVPVDYDGDGKADLAVYREGEWFILRSSDGGHTTVAWGGVLSDVPVPADYNGDGKADIAVYRDGTWFILLSSGDGCRPGTMGARSRPPRVIRARAAGTTDRSDSRQKAPLQRIAANTRKITQFAVTSFRIDKTAHVPPHALIEVGGLRAGCGVTRSSKMAVACAPRWSLPWLFHISIRASEQVNALMMCQFLRSALSFS